MFVLFHGRPLAWHPVRLSVCVYVLNFTCQLNNPTAARLKLASAQFAQLMRNLFASVDL